MPNRPRREAEPEKYEGKPWLTYEEACEYLGIRRSALYQMVMDLKIETKKFDRDKRRYLAIADVKRMREIRENPWLAEEGKEDKNAA